MSFKKRNFRGSCKKIIPQLDHPEILRLKLYCFHHPLRANWKSETHIGLSVLWKKKTERCFNWSPFLGHWGNQILRNGTQSFLNGWFIPIHLDVDDQINIDRYLNRHNIFSGRSVQSQDAGMMLGPGFVSPWRSCIPRCKSGRGGRGPQITWV